MNQRLVSIAFGVAIAWALPLTAFSAYTWIDDNGTMVFSDRAPPPGTPYSRVRPASSGAVPAALEKLEAQRSKIARINQDRAERDQRREQQQNESAGKQQNCTLANTKLKQLTDNPRVFSVARDGTRNRLSEPERQRQIAEARALAASHCSN